MISSLDNLFSKHPQFRLASIEDAQAISEFVETKVKFGQSMEVTYKREPHFFTFLNLQSQDNYVFTHEENGKITAIGSLVLKNVYLDGSIKRVGILSDLKVRGNLKFSRYWKSLLCDLITHGHEIEEVNTSLFFTTIYSGNEKAKTSLIEDTKSGFYYYKISDIESVNLISSKGQFWLHEDIDVLRLNSNDEAAVEQFRAFFDSCNRKRPFGHTLDSLDHYLSTWPNFDWSQFLIATYKGKIVGCMAPWNASPAKYATLEKQTFKKGFVSSLLRLFSKTAKVGSRIEQQFLNFCNLSCEDVEHREIFLSMLAYLQKEGMHSLYHMVSFHSNLVDENFLNKFYFDKSYSELYQVCSTNSKPIELTNTEPLNFEISLM